jgi:hypothetical protein
MGDLAARIALEHSPQKVSSRGYVMCATCGTTFALVYYALHIATVTEQAVRERVAAQIDAFEPDDLALIHMSDWREAMYDAARIARGDTP